MSTSPLKNRTRCPLCDGANVKLFQCDFDGLLTCLNDGFIFADPAYLEQHQADYEDDFASSNRHPTFIRKNGNYVIRNENKLTHILKNIESFKTHGRILDVGCSAAFFLKLAERHGWQPQGVEISDFGVQFSQKELGLPVFQGTLQEAKFEDSSFDVIFSSHVMEHIEQPLDLLLEMHRVLRPGGIHITVIPSQFTSLGYRLKGHVHGDPPPRHVSFYTRKTYEAFLRKAGFSPKRAFYNVELNRLSHLVRRPKGNSAIKKTSDGVDPGFGEGYGGGIAFVKKIVNGLATAANIGDEIYIEAIRPE